MNTNYLAAAPLLLVCSVAAAQTTPPSEVPQVTVTADTKLLVFDWQPVPGATYYQLYVNADGHSGFSKTGPQIAAPGTRAGYSVPVHLQHWQDALYRLSACNAAGCRDSKSLFPRRHMLETIGYFKASNADPGDNFAHAVRISGDGGTLIVGARNEGSKATGVNGNQSDNSLLESGAVYVFRKVGGHWRQEAYLKPRLNRDRRHFGFGSESLGLTTDGSTVVVGAADGQNTSDSAVYTFVRASNGIWSPSSTLQGPSGDNNGFGFSVDISGDGRTLRVEGNDKNFLYTRSASGSWEFQQAIPPAHAGDYCNTARMSRDGSTVVQTCGIPYQATRVETYKRSGSSWTLAPEYPVGDTLPDTTAISDDANRFAFQLHASDGSASVRVFRWVDGQWLEEANLVSSDLGYSAWGQSLSFNGTGTLLAIGQAVSNPAGPPGVSEDVPTAGPANSGNVFVYQRHTAATSVSWDFRSHVLAPNPDDGDAFGYSVSLSATGSTLAVGAFVESSSARGINGDQTSNGSRDAGAVYLY